MNLFPHTLGLNQGSLNNLDGGVSLVKAFQNPFILLSILEWTLDITHVSLC